MKRGFLANSPQKAPAAGTAPTSDAQKNTAAEIAESPTKKGASCVHRLLIATQNFQEQPSQKKATRGSDNASAAKPELENLVFVTIPPRRPGRPDDPDGHTELMVPKNGDLPEKIKNTRGYPKAVPKTSQNYIVKPTEDMGIAMFATRNFKKGELVFAERPFLCAPETVMNRIDFDFAATRGLSPDDRMKVVNAFIEKRLQHLLSRMSEADKKLIMELENSHKDKEENFPITGRMRTNSYSIEAYLWDVIDGLFGPTKSGYLIVGNEASRINHSCMPNITQLFDIASFSVQFLASRSFHRQAYLMEHYSFECKCYACTNNSPESDAFRRDFPQKIEALTEKCNDMIGGLVVISHGQARPRVPRKPNNPKIHPRLKKEVLEPALRLQADIEREGLGLYQEATALWLVISRAWEVIPGEYAAKKSREASNEVTTQVKMYGL
ncbi:hypothetical protein GALMADRAFT_146961 [Galerina marginata CBS 339.88]|uniref:SET domain-containing protein n=1 Tax=Galerina marginata (strain CBS 339.88) TaxID=685588 RepID=A0A067SA05_GALM3|nr:hypothetical protein GALMADRAFT_146961 [Galerina marginata CBS 339.88]